MNVSNKLNHRLRKLFVELGYSKDAIGHWSNIDDNGVIRSWDTCGRFKIEDEQVMLVQVSVTTVEICNAVSIDISRVYGGIVTVSVLDFVDKSSVRFSNFTTTNFDEKFEIISLAVRKIDLLIQQWRSSKDIFDAIVENPSICTVTKMYLQFIVARLSLDPTAVNSKNYLEYAKFAEPWNWPFDSSVLAKN